SQIVTARGTIDLAYGLLAGEGYILPRGAAGTVVAPGLESPSARRRPRRPRSVPATEADGPPRTPEGLPLPFQMGLPALDLFPRNAGAARGGPRAAPFSHRRSRLRGSPRLRASAPRDCRPSRRGAGHRRNAGADPDHRRLPGRPRPDHADPDAAGRPVLDRGS